MTDKSNYEIPNEEEFLELSENAIAVFSVRCALRTLPILTIDFGTQTQTPEYRRSVVMLNQGISQLAKNVNDVTSRVALKGYARIALAKVVDLALDVVRAIADGQKKAAVNLVIQTAQEAAVVKIEDATLINQEMITAMRKDFSMLLELGDYVTSDASEEGSLSNLWHGMPPKSYEDDQSEYYQTIDLWQKEFDPVT